MCHRSPSTRDEYDRPPYGPPTVKAEPYWPHFVAADDGCCWDDGFSFHVRLPAPMGGKETWVGVSHDDAASNVDAYPGVPVEAGAFIEAAQRYAERSPELRQFRQLIKLLDMVAEVAMDMLAGHGRLCGCPLCVMFAAHDDRQPGLKAAIWARIGELPVVLRPVSGMFHNWVCASDVSTTKAIRRSGRRCGYRSPAVEMAYPERAARPPALPAPPARPQLKPATTN